MGYSQVVGIGKRILISMVVSTFFLFWAVFSANASSVITTTTTVRIPATGNWGLIILGMAFVGAIAWLLKARRSLQ